MNSRHRARRFVVLLASAIIMFSIAAYKTDGPPPIADIFSVFQTKKQPTLSAQNTSEQGDLALMVLETLEIKGRAPKTGYERTQFSNGWAQVEGCDERNNILRRDLRKIVEDKDCRVLSGVLQDPYTGKIINFQRGPSTSAAVQIDHVVALSNAWQTGAQNLSYERRHALANDPLELLAVDGPANQQKSDGDAASWLPSYKPFRCQYVARQIAVKQKYSLWVTKAEKEAMQRVLMQCPNEKLPTR